MEWKGANTALSTFPGTGLVFRPWREIWQEAEHWLQLNYRREGWWWTLNNPYTPYNSYLNRWTRTNPVRIIWHRPGQETCSFVQLIKRYVMQTCEGVEVYLHISWLRQLVSFEPRPLCPRGQNPLYPLDKRLGGPHGRSECRVEEKDLILTEIPALAVHPVARRYAKWVIPRVFNK